MNLTDYRKYLGLSYSDEERVELFKIRLFNYLRDINISISNSEYFQFCNLIGVTALSSSYDRRKDVIRVLLSFESDFKRLLFGCVALIHSIIYKSDARKLACILEGCLDSCEIPFEVIEDDDGYFVFPKGAQELDAALVSQPLLWMESYPKSREVFIQALKKYSTPNSNDARTIADEFRKALEGFFQEFFNSQKSLENLKSEYGSYLKGHGIPKEIASNLENLLQLYTNYMNNYVKHKDNASDELLEYIMYQTGNIIRLLIQLKNSDEAPLG